MTSNDPYFGFYKQQKPKENIRFGKFNSFALGYELIERSAPLPSEKLIVENIPFSDGVQDYSQIIGKYYEERELTYTLTALRKNYEERKQLEILSKQLASLYDYTQLYDSHDRGYYWKAKLKSMTFTDDSANNLLTCSLSFTAKPYMYRSDDGFNDRWDSFNFEKDVAQFYLYEVKATKVVRLIIPSGQKVEPTFELLSGNLTVAFKNYRKKLDKGMNATPFIAFDGVINYVAFEGNGVVKIHYDIGVMG